MTRAAVSGLSYHTGMSGTIINGISHMEMLTKNPISRFADKPGQQQHWSRNDTSDWRGRSPADKDLWDPGQTGHVRGDRQCQ